MSAQPNPHYSAEEYLELERRAETKSEYFDGEIFAMSGASETHNTISLNIASEFRAAFKGTPCRAYVSDLRVNIADTGLYTYPDVVAVCGGPQFTDAHVDTLLNPTVVVEVLSPSTEAYDRGAKFRNYRSVPTLREYVLVAQDAPRVEVYARQPDGRWLLTQDVEGLESSVQFAALGITLPLADIYDRVTFLPTGGVAPPPAA
jgi:Uma2 family endonuclease